MTMDPKAPPDIVEKHENDMRQVVEGLESIHPTVIYIPGNHDAVTTFRDDPPQMTPQSISLHKRSVQLTPSLRLIGFGGSVPGVQNGEKVFEGFPYQTEEEFAEEFLPAIEQFQLSDFLGSTILMTHIGPASLGTAVDRSDILNPVEMGSTTLRKTMESAALQKTVFLHIHGHSHGAPGSIKVGRTTIVNPGPLRYGCFALYTVAQQLPDSVWKLSELTIGRVE
ncbi:uncharacterized protein LOC134196284 isoform X2 [Corticium candelabrum]|nr:uncharacterized protein LOC134196284 isoform X2 [Corticium candelabrum]